MAKQRSRRLRKKMRIDEFQELGFSVEQYGVYYDALCAMDQERITEPFLNYYLGSYD